MLIIGNGKVITRNPEMPFIENGGVVIDGEEIIAIDTMSKLAASYHDYKFIDAAGQLIMPGMINSHMHFYSTFARGMFLKDAPPQNFLEILERLWWRLDKVLTLEDVYYSALPMLIDCIKNGTTTIFDHHASPSAVRGSLYQIAEAAKLVGVRGAYCYEVSDRDGEEIKNQGIAENMDFIKYCQQNNDPMLRGMFGLHAAMTLSDNTLAQCAEANEGSGAGFHIHTAEANSDQEFSVNQYGKRVVERLNDFGLLGEKSIAVHCVHIDAQEMAILKQNDTIVVHNPESNMGNAVGCSPVLQMCEQGICLGLGTDGYTSDMFESFKVANILHKHNAANPSVSWGEIPQMLFGNNPRIAARYWEKPLGILKPGAYGDVIVVDYTPATPLTADNVNGHLLFGVNGRMVTSTITGGIVRMENRQLVDIDEAEVCAKARELAADVWRRF